MLLTKLDWYILKKYVLTFTFAILLLTFITIVIDVSEKSDDFVKSGLGFWDIVTEYYAGFVPRMMTMLFPLFIFISVIYFTSKMAGRSEIIAILASGVSFNRFLRPYWIGAIFFAVVLWLAFSYVTPVANRKFSQFEEKYVSSANFSNQYRAGTMYFRNDTTHYGQVSYFDTLTKRGSNFSLQEIVDNQMVMNLRADQLVYDTAVNEWKVENAVIRTIAPEGEKIWMTKDTIIHLNFRPEEFKKGQYTKDVLKTPELAEYIENERMRGSENINELVVELHRRTATPVSLILLTMMGVAVSSRKVRGGSGLHLAIGIILAALFILTDRFSTIFSTKGSFPPILAAWTPNIIFLFVTLYLFRMSPR